MHPPQALLRPLKTRPKHCSHVRNHPLGSGGARNPTLQPEPRQEVFPGLPGCFSMTEQQSLPSVQAQRWAQAGSARDLPAATRLPGPGSQKQKLLAQPLAEDELLTLIYQSRDKPSSRRHPPAEMKGTAGLPRLHWQSQGGKTFQKSCSVPAARPQQARRRLLAIRTWDVFSKEPPPRSKRLKKHQASRLPSPSYGRHIPARRALRRKGQILG